MRSSWEVIIITKRIKDIIKSKGPQVIEVMAPSDQLIIPKVSSTKLSNGKMVSNSIENMSPLLDSIIIEKELNFINQK